MPNPRSEEEAKAWMNAGLGDVYLKIAYGYAVPVFWFDPRETPRPAVKHLGTAFFVDAGRGPFAVTARHVVEAYRMDRAEAELVCQTGKAVIDIADRMIAQDPDIDVATFSVSSKEIAVSGKTAMTYPKKWPPPPPEQGRGVFFGGYRRDDLVETPDHTSFGFSGALAPVDIVRDGLIKLAFARERLVSIGPERPLAAGERWRGASGGPVITVVADRIDYWRLGGVLVEHNEAFDIFTGAGLSHLNADGTFDRES